MHVWITRAQPGADLTAQRLRILGHAPLVAPLLEVRPVDGAIDLDGIGALAFTSANAVAAFAERSLSRNLPVFTVGDATAAAARAARFSRVQSAEGDVDALAALITARRGAFTGAVLHPGARDLAGDLKGALNAAGLKARNATVYETLVLPPSPEALEALPSLDAILIHSPRAARALSDLAAARPIKVLCLSPAAVPPLRAQGFTDVEAADTPTELALLALLRP